MKLDDWIGMLQEQVDAAWQDPHSTESLMAILMFNEDRQLSLDPPQLSPFTRLNPVQAWLFASGLYTYIFTREDGEQNCPSKFWRNAFWMKSDYLQARVAEGANKTLLYLNGVSMMPTLLNLLGSSTMLAQDLTYLFVNFKQGVIVPDPPRLLGATVSQRPMGGQFVTISFKINTAQEPASNFYTLYRFEPRSQKRTAVTRWQPPADMAAFDLAWEVTDEEPPVGQVFYSMATTKFLKPLADFSEYELEQMKPWWESPLLGADPYIVAKTTKSLMSDYSEPKVVTVGPAGIDASIDDIELNPADGNLYYGDKQNQAIYQIENGGLGSRYPFVSTGFKLPGQQGLAIDRSGNVYSENSASDTNFGGRIFRYQLGTGSREFCGSLNYFSQVLMYAQPVSAGAMTMGIDNRLYQVEQLSQRIKQVDVNATYDPYRRVGQDWAVIPENVAGTAFDIESDFGGNLYLLYFGVQKPARTKFFAETSTYLETPMYQGQRTLPTYDGGLITLYGITHVEMVANVFDGNSLPIGNALVNFSTDYGRFVTSSSVRTDENGRAAATLRVVVPRSDWPKKEVKVTANVASLAADYECKIEIIDNYKRLQERYMQEIPRGIIMRDGTYYTSGMGGFGPPGVINNILQAGYSMAGEKRADEIGNFVCGGYQGQVLEWLNKIRLSEDEEQFLFNGLEYGPISAFNFGHHAVVVYPNDKNWWDPESLAFDPWLYQEPVLTPWPEWNALMIATGTPDFCAYGLAKAYPIVGGEFYPGPAGAKPVPQPPYKAVVEFKPSGDPWANKADVQVVRPAGTMTIPSTGAPETTIPGSHIYVPPGNQYGSIALPEGPSNMTFRPPQSGMFDLTVWYGNGTVARYLNVPGAAMQAFRLNIVPDAPEPNLLPEGGDPIPPTGGMGPVPMIIDIQPPSAHPGETLTVTLTGGGTRFLEGVSTIGFGPVIQVNSFTVLGPTSAEANITIPADAEAGEYAPSIVSPGERAMARDTFKVVVE